MLYSKPLASCRSPTALKKPDRSKQCHCLKFFLLSFLNGLRKPCDVIILFATIVVKTAASSICT